MKIMKIVNPTFALRKFAKLNEDIAVSAASSSAKPERYNNSNFFNNERGTLKKSEISLTNEIKTAIPELISLISLPKFKTKLSTYKPLLDSPKEMIAFSIDNPKYMAISGKVKNVIDDSYLDLSLYGYSGDKKRFLINNEGEIVKSLTPNFFAKGQEHIYNPDDIYYNQHELNNLGLNKYLKIYNDELLKLKEFINKKEIPLKGVETKVVIDYSSFLYKQNEALKTLRENFNLLYNGIMNNSRSSAQRSYYESLCGVKIRKSPPIIKIENINSGKSSASINFFEIGKKPVTRIVVSENASETNRLFINGKLVEEASRDRSNPFVAGRILKIYSPYETDILGIPKLLENINNKFSDGIKQLRAFIGDRIYK